jgi:hypothetical protein
LAKHGDPGGVGSTPLGTPHRSLPTGAFVCNGLTGSNPIHFAPVIQIQQPNASAQNGRGGRGRGGGGGGDNKSKMEKDVAAALTRSARVPQPTRGQAARRPLEAANPEGSTNLAATAPEGRPGRHVSFSRPAPATAADATADAATDEGTAGIDLGTFGGLFGPTGDLLESESSGSRRSRSSASGSSRSRSTIVPILGESMMRSFADAVKGVARADPEQARNFLDRVGANERRLARARVAFPAPAQPEPEAPHPAAGTGLHNLRNRQPQQ